MARCLYTLCSKRLVFSRHACVECRVQAPEDQGPEGPLGARRDLRSAAGHLHAAIAVLPLARRIPLGAVGSLRHHIHWVTVDNSPSHQQSRPQAPQMFWEASSKVPLPSSAYSEIVAEHGAAVQHGCGARITRRRVGKPGIDRPRRSPLPCLRDHLLDARHQLRDVIGDAVLDGPLDTAAVHLLAVPSQTPS